MRGTTAAAKRGKTRQNCRRGSFTLCACSWRESWRKAETSACRATLLYTGAHLTSRAACIAPLTPLRLAARRAPPHLIALSSVCAYSSPALLAWREQWNGERWAISEMEKAMKSIKAC
jgi:hypothetical protein